MTNKEKTDLEIRDHIIKEFKAGLIYAISYEKPMNIEENIIHNIGYDFLEELKQEMYQRNGNKIYNQ